ncbi:MAG: hypothetical protein WCJ35_12555 [Planctomycetota bacterium]
MPRCRRRFYVRRASVTVLATLLIVVGVLLTILVVDASYLVAVNRGMQDVSSIMALAGAPELLDPNLLRDAAGLSVPNQAAARTAATTVADTYRQYNNRVLPSLQRVDAGDVVVQTGFVDDVTVPKLELSSTEPDNTVFVYAARTTGGTHPVTYPVDLAGTKRMIEIRGGAYATLDNLVVGFRPETAMAAPLMPMGILSMAWTGERTADSNGNGINEMVIRLQSAHPPSASSYPPQPNGALLFYGGSITPEVLSQTLPRQVAQGLFPADLSSSGSFGPATSGLLAPVLGTSLGDGGDPGTTAIVAAFAGTIGQKRVFPLVQGMTGVGTDGTGIAQVEGFVACTVLGAEVVDNRLTVRVEPCYLIHHTAWTVPSAAVDTPVGLQRNLYIYKLRLSR